MKKEVTVTEKTVELAVKNGAEQLGVAEDEVTYEVITAPKKGFLGFGETDATVKVVYESAEPYEAGLAFVNRVISDMKLDAKAVIVNPDGKKEFTVDISGKDAGTLIGHHGETLDALQYLTNLAANRRDDDEDESYIRYEIDIENYRSRREDTLRRLAKRTAEKALKTGRSITLEPMPSYERRIIHSEIQSIKGVTTNSVGSDMNRRVVVIVEDKKASRKAKPVKETAPKAEEKAADISEEDYGEDYVPSTTIGPITKRARFDDTLPEYVPGEFDPDKAEN